MDPRYFFNFAKYGYIRGDRPPGCILCSVRDQDGRAVDLSLAESPHMVVTGNLYPFNPGHCLVFPKRHLLSLEELSDAEALDLHHCCQAVLAVLRTSQDAAGFNIGWNLGQVAGASIDHIHLQIIPRYPNELGMADLIAGQRPLVEDPRQGAERLREAFARDGRLKPRQPGPA